MGDLDSLAVTPSIKERAHNLLDEKRVALRRLEDLLVNMPGQLQREQCPQVGECRRGLLSRKELGHLLLKLQPSARIIVVAADADEISQHLHERRIRTSLPERDRRRVQPKQRTLLGVRPGVDKQSCLSNSRLAGNQYEAANSRGKPVEAP